MLDAYEELKLLATAFGKGKVEYALCGGMALAVHGKPRATMDIDVMVPDECLEAAKSAAEKIGYAHRSRPMRLAGGKIRIHRLTKVEPGSKDFMSLDLLVVTPAVRQTWERREQVSWEGLRLSVVSREGLIALKSLRGSGQDRDDIKSLRGRKR